MEELAEKQFEYAIELGAAYGHAWAVALKYAMKAGELLPERTADAISNWVLEQDPDEIGITGPSIHDGAVTHTTGSGRLEWVINEVGSVFLRINRPGYDEPVLELGYFAEGSEIMLKIPRRIWRSKAIPLATHATVVEIEYDDDDECAGDRDCGWALPDEPARFSNRHVNALQDALVVLLRVDNPQSPDQEIVHRAESILKPYQMLAAEEAVTTVFIEGRVLMDLATMREYEPALTPHFVRVGYQGWYIVCHEGKPIFPVKGENEAQTVCTALRDNPDRHWMDVIVRMGR